MIETLLTGMLKSLNKQYLCIILRNEGVAVPIDRRPHDRAVKSAVFYQSLDHLMAVSGVGLSLALTTCETSQVLFVGV